MRRAEGFTLLEVLIAAAIGVVVTVGLVQLVHGTLAAASSIATHRHAYAMAEELSDRWDAEATSALAIFVPPNDVLGNANTDGHEVDFFSRDGHGTPFFWAYRFDGSQHTLQRYTYAAPGANAVPSGVALTGVSSFTAVAIDVNAFGESLFQGHANTPVVEHLGYPGVDGGNRVTEVHLVTADDDVTSDLLPGVAPSGFTVVVGTFTPPPSPLIVNPTSLTFTTPSAPPQSFSVSQQWYVGNFGVPSQCIVGTGQSVPAGTVAATISGSTAGPSATLIVTPNRSMTNTQQVVCTLAITGGGEQTATETIFVDPFTGGSGAGGPIPVSVTLNNVYYCHGGGGGCAQDGTKTNTLGTYNVGYLQSLFASGGLYQFPWAKMDNMGDPSVGAQVQAAILPMSPTANVLITETINTTVYFCVHGNC